MKNLSLAIATLIFVITSVSAQDNPYLAAGRSFAGGGLSLSVDSNVPDDDNPQLKTDDRYFLGSVSPTYGMFFRDRWVAGVSLTLSYQNNQRQTTGENTFQENSAREFGVGITPFLRRYWPITERFGAYLQPELSYSYFRGTVERVQRDANQPAANRFFSTIRRRHVGSLGAQAGLYYFITEHFSVETNLLRAAFTLSSRRDETTTQDNVVDQTGESTNLSARFSFINELSLDRILVLNYYF